MSDIKTKMKNIHIDDISTTKSKSNIIIRHSYNPLDIGKPVAVVNCGECGAKYKEKLFRLHGGFEKIKKLKCPECGHSDIFSYSNC